MLLKKYWMNWLKSFLMRIKQKRLLRQLRSPWVKKCLSQMCNKLRPSQREWLSKLNLEKDSLNILDKE